MKDKYLYCWNCYVSYIGGYFQEFVNYFLDFIVLIYVLEDKKNINCFQLFFGVLLGQVFVVLK